MISPAKKVSQLWHRLPDSVRRVLHTAWQVGLSTLLTNLLVAKSSTDVKAAVTVSLAASLAAVKAAVVSNR